MTITTNVQLAAAMITGAREVYMKTGTVSNAQSGHFVSMFQAAGYPGAGAAPSGGLNGDVPTNATAGVIPYVNATAGTQKYVGAFGANMSPVGAGTGTAASTAKLFLYDLLWHNTITVNSTGAQSVTFPGLPSRDANGAALGDGVEAWYMVHTSTAGGSNMQCTISYTNKSGTAGRTGVTGLNVITNTAGGMYPFTLQAGDVGVRSIQTITQSAGVGTAPTNVVGVALIRRLAEVQISQYNRGAEVNFYDMGAPRLWDGSALSVGFYGPFVTVNPTGYVHLIEG